MAQRTDYGAGEKYGKQNTDAKHQKEKHADVEPLCPDEQADVAFIGGGQHSKASVARR